AAICSASRRSRISSCTASSLFLLANLTDITNSERITHRNHISLREMCPICGGLTPRITICYTPRSVCFCILRTHAACAILVCVGRDDGQPAGGQHEGCRDPHHVLGTRAHVRIRPYDWIF